MNSVIIDILNYFTFLSSDWSSFVTKVAQTPAGFIIFIFCVFFALMLILSVFKIFAMILRIFLDWRLYR